MLPYLALRFKQLGFSAGQVGVLVGIRPLSELFMFPWGWVADKYKKRREILQVAIISTAASALLVVSVQPEHHKCVEILGEAENKAYPVSLGSGYSRFGVPFDTFMSESKICVGKTPTTQNKTVQYQMDYGDKNELNYMFTLILVLTILGQIVGCGLASFPEALLVAHLEEKINKFGAIRLWGDLGEAVASFAVGVQEVSKPRKNRSVDRR